MKKIPTSLPDVWILEPTVFGDERGYFYEAFNQQVFAQLGFTQHFVQDNQSRSPRGILRGLHYQIRQPQDKLVRCLRGAIYDVIVDIRRGSPTFGKWVATELSETNKRMLWVPKGYAHGFVVTSESADVLYKVTDYWSKEHERGLRWNDPIVGIPWPDVGVAPQLNQRDATWPLLADIPLTDRPEYQP
jgi:dTDP-4-dehydrorhamnose 3,5-epimerase